MNTDIQFKKIEDFRNYSFFSEDNENKVIGVFSIKLNPNNIYAIHRLDIEDIRNCSGLHMRKGEQIFSYQSEKMKNYPLGNNQFGYTSYVKINYVTEKIYFVDKEKTTDGGRVIFETKGYKMHFMHVVDSEFTNK